MAPHQHEPDSQPDRIVPLRPRPGLPEQPARQPDRPPVEDLGKYTRDNDGDDDYRHRMMTNAAAFVVCILLVLGAIWLATSIADMRKIQDCVLSGRRNCSPLTEPTRNHW